MPVRRRRKHQSTLRFKPDLWGRETESGTVLFDGVVNLAYDEDEGAHHGRIQLLESVVDGSTCIVTVNGNAVECLASVDDVNYVISSSDDSIYINSNTAGTSVWITDAHGGENTLKIVQTD